MRLPVTSLRPVGSRHRTTRQTLPRGPKTRVDTDGGAGQAASPAATKSTNATVRYATGGRSHAWMLFGPAARTAPVATAYNPAAAKGSAHTRQIAATTPVTAIGSAVVADTSRSNAGISNTSTTALKPINAAGRLLR